MDLAAAWWESLANKDEKPADCMANTIMLTAGPCASDNPHKGWVVRKSGWWRSSEKHLRQRGSQEVGLAPRNDTLSILLPL